MVKELFKKISFYAAGIIILTLCISTAGRAESDKEKLAAEQKRREMIENAKEDLNDTTWKIELSQMGSGAKVENISDTVRFADNEVESEILASEGFPGTSFTVSIKDNAAIVWETMQTSEKGGLAFWKGEIKDGVMRGVLSRHLNGKTVKDYSFITVEKGKEIILDPSKRVEKPKEKPAAAATERKAVETAPATPAAPAAPVKVETKEKEPQAQAQEPKKEETKKKSWWQR